MTSQEQVGAAFRLEALLQARQLGWQAIAEIARQIQPGMHESAARRLAERTLQALGAERLWHPALVRFGVNTLKTYAEPSEGDPLLAEDDIYFIDLGPVWQGHEGDCGATFVTGAEAQKLACAAVARQLFDEVSDYWRRERVSGGELYRFAGERAQALGWVLHPQILGHRVSDFPHAQFQAGDLGALDSCPQPGCWILEIQLRHPTLEFGAFYEDLLL